MITRVDELLDELARRYGAGEELDMAGLLERAGDERDAFAMLAERFLEAAPRRVATAESAAYLAALGEPPLLRARVSRRLRVAEVVERLAVALKVTDRDRLARYYQRLEGGVLDAQPVDERVWRALTQILGAPARKLALLRPAEMDAAPAFYRRSDAMVPTPGVASSSVPAPAPVTADPEPAARDDLDRLFLGET